MLKTTIAAFPSMTKALSAERALSRAAIRSRIVKLNATQTSRGCAYGLEFAAAQQNNVISVLTAASIPIPRFLGGEQP